MQNLDTTLKHLFVGLRVQSYNLSFDFDVSLILVVLQSTEFFKEQTVDLHLNGK